ncbi:PRP38-domain-containing protein [Violaceomyces palustris]|uniref:PRP38-domain-containing protein n=1 Tax=Violaceomyces palustris TaxID=1673888 RepID=A0ACD0NY73_9BASI|nr:PRP38-domain-containing protein [Violaceomyces palustris]
MANTTAKGALNIHGTNPQFLVEKVVRSRIYDSLYWKEHCFGLTAESLIDKAVELEYVGGMYGMQRPSPFLCLVLKLLQLQPEKEIILEYLAAEEFKYLRAVAAMYVRLTFSSVEVYEVLEPMLNDYRKLRWRDLAGNYSLSYMDTFVDQLLQEQRVCDIILPRLTRRDVLEEIEGLAPRISKLEEVLVMGKAGLEDGRADSQDEESDDSAAEERRERKRRLERAARVRESKMRENQLALGMVTRQGLGEREEDEEQDGYVSQEESDDVEGLSGRYVSRSPSRSVSPDRREEEDRSRYISPSRSVSPDRMQAGRDTSQRSRSNSPDGGGGWRSRSASISPDRDVPKQSQDRIDEGGYVSRSPSRSPDRD